MLTISVQGTEYGIGLDEDGKVIIPEWMSDDEEMIEDFICESKDFAKKLSVEFVENMGYLCRRAIARRPERLFDLRLEKDEKMIETALRCCNPGSICNVLVPLMAAHLGVQPIWFKYIRTESLLSLLDKFPDFVEDYSAALSMATFHWKNMDIVRMLEQYRGNKDFIMGIATASPGAESIAAEWLMDDDEFMQELILMREGVVN